MVKLTDEQWERIREHFPEERRLPGQAGRKPIPTRWVLEAVLWILNTGAQWHMLPQCYPNYKTVHRRFQTWCRHEVLRDILVDVANTLRERGGLDESESFIDAMFSSAKGGGAEVGPTKRGKGVKIMGIVDREGLPLSVSTHAANHHEVTLVQLSFEFYMIEATPEHLIGDKAYDSDPLDAELKVEGVEMIAPHRKNRKRRKTQDGLRRPQFSWTRIRGESDVKGGGGHGWSEASAGSGVGADGGSPEGERSRRRRRGGWGGGLGARAAVEREPETGRGSAAAARRVAGDGLARSRFGALSPGGVAGAGAGRSRAGSEGAGR